MLDERSWLNTLQTYVQSLPERPSWNAYFMSAAILLSARSTCERLHVGCILVSENGNRIISSGYNGHLSGLPHQSCVINDHEQLTVHAEQNAIAGAAKRGASTQNAIAYVTHYPCIHCAKILLAAGIKHCYFHEDYKNDPLVAQLFQNASIGLEQF